MEGITSKIVFGVILILFMAWQVHTQVNCTALGAGRHPNTNDTTCQNYTLCVFITANNSFVSYAYTCPTTSVFNPNNARCTTNYVCPTTAG